MSEAESSRTGIIGWQNWACLQRVPPLSPKTIREYSFRIRSALGCFGDRLDQINTKEIEKFLFAQKPTARTRNQVRCALVNYFDYVVSQGVRPDNPASSLPRLPERRPIPVPIDDPRQLLTEAWEYSTTFGVIVTLFLNTGLRLNEVTQLRWEQIHDCWAYVLQKGGRQRAVFLNEECTRALALLEKKSDWIFPSPVKDGSLSSVWVWRKIRDLGYRAGIPGCRPHRLRYTFADSVVELSGGDAFVVRDALGHRSLQSAMHYVSARPQAVRKVLEQLVFDLDDSKTTQAAELLALSMKVLRELRHTTDARNGLS